MVFILVMGCLNLSGQPAIFNGYILYRLQLKGKESDKLMVLTDKHLKLSVQYPFIRSELLGDAFLEHTIGSIIYRLDSGMCYQVFPEKNRIYYFPLLSDSHATAVQKTRRPTKEKCLGYDCQVYSSDHHLKHTAGRISITTWIQEQLVISMDSMPYAFAFPREVGAGMSTGRYLPLKRRVIFKDSGIEILLEAIKIKAEKFPDEFFFLPQGYALLPFEPYAEF